MLLERTEWKNRRGGRGGNSHSEEALQKHVCTEIGKGCRINNEILKLGI